MDMGSNLHAVNMRLSDRRKFKKILDKIDYILYNHITLDITDFLLLYM